MLFPVPVISKTRLLRNLLIDYSLWSEELQFTFVNCLQIIHKFQQEHEKEYSLHVVGAVGSLTMSCIGDSDSNKQQS